MALIFIDLVFQDQSLVGVSKSQSCNLILAVHEDEFVLHEQVQSTWHFAIIEFVLHNILTQFHAVLFQDIFTFFVFDHKKG